MTKAYTGGGNTEAGAVRAAGAVRRAARAAVAAGRAGAQEQAAPARPRRQAESLHHNGHLHHDRARVEALEGRTLFVAPTAVLVAVPDITARDPFIEFTVTYSDDTGVDPASLGLGLDGTHPADLIVRGPGGFSAVAAYQVVDPLPAPAASLQATYRIPAPAGRLSAFANGTYTVSTQAGGVADVDGEAAAVADIGSFQVDVPAAAGGNLDNGFATDFAVRALRVLSNGKVLALGSEPYGRFGAVDEGEDPNAVVVHTRQVLRRFNADGSIDTTFGGGDGRVETSIDTDSGGFALAVDSGGKIYAGGFGGNEATIGTQFAVVRFNSNGSVDGGYGNAGRVAVEVGPGVNGADAVHAIGIQSDGKVVLAGQATTIDTGDPDVYFALARLNANGTVDESFGQDATGIVVTNVTVGDIDAIGRMVIGPADEIVVAGRAGADVAVARYSADGVPDAAFDGDGVRVLTALASPVSGPDRDFNVGLARLGNGGLLVAATPDSGAGFALTRLNANGSTDTAFGTGGTATATFGGGSTADADAVQVLASGKYIVLGTTTTGGTTRTAGALFGTNGALEPDGTATFDPAAATTDVAQSVAAVLDNGGNPLFARPTGAGAGQLRRIEGDTAGPAAVLTTVPAVTTAGGTTLTLTVTFTDDVAINASTINGQANSTITVTGPGGPMNATLAMLDSNSNGATRTATYTFAAPGGTFDAVDNGVYTVAVAANKVADTTGNFVPAGALGTFSVNIAEPGAPTAALTAVPPVTTAGGTALTFTITYTGESAIDAATIDAGDVTVTPPGGGAPLTVTGVTTTGSGTSVSATYTVAAPGGTFGNEDNGAYAVAVVPGQVRDVGNRSVTAATVGSFTVNVPTGGGGTPLGQFGTVDGRQRTLTVDDADGTRVVLSLRGGTGTATLRNGRIDLALAGTTAASVVTIRGTGGTDGRVTLGNVTADGPVRTITAINSDVAGTLSVNGAAAKVVIGSLTGAVQTAGAMGTLDVRGGAGGTVQSGAGITRLLVRGPAGGAVTAAGAITTLDVRGNLTGAVTAGGPARKLVVTGDLASNVAVAGPVTNVDVRGSLTGRLSSTGTINRLLVRDGLTGTATAAGGIARVDVRGAAGGTIATAGGIARLTVGGNLTGTVAAGAGLAVLVVRGDASNAFVLSGANLGADDAIGGTGPAADTYGPGAFSTIAITGAVSDSLFGAGLDPGPNGTFGDADDAVIGVAESVMNTVTVRGGVDTTSRFIAGAFGRVRAPEPVDPATDPRFEII